MFVNGCLDERVDGLSPMRRQRAQKHLLRTAELTANKRNQVQDLSRSTRPVHSRDVAKKFFEGRMEKHRRRTKYVCQCGGWRSRAVAQILIQQHEAGCATTISVEALQDSAIDRALR